MNDLYRRHSQHYTQCSDSYARFSLAPGQPLVFLLGRMELHVLEEVHALQTLRQVPGTQLDTQAIMHELSVDSEVTFRKVMGWAEILPTRPGFDPFEDTRPMDNDWSGSACTPSVRSSLYLTLITSISPSVIAPCTASGSDTSHIHATPQALHFYSITPCPCLVDIRKRVRS